MSGGDKPEIEETEHRYDDRKRKSRRRYDKRMRGQLQAEQVTQARRQFPTGGPETDAERAQPLSCTGWRPIKAFVRAQPLWCTGLMSAVCLLLAWQSRRFRVRPSAGSGEAARSWTRCECPGFQAASDVLRAMLLCTTCIFSCHCFS